MLGIRLGFRVNTVRVQYKMLNVARHYTILVRGIPLPTSRERRSRRTMMSLASTTKVTVRCPHTGRTDRRGPVAALNVASEPRRTRKTRVQSAATSPIVQSTAAVLAFALNASAVQPAFASSEELFTKTCAGCHAAGGNIVQAGATLFPDDLKRNGIDDAAAVYDIIYGGKGKMPGYGEGCAPKGQCTFGARLADEDVKGLAEYVIERSAAEWK